MGVEEGLRVNVGKVENLECGLGCCGTENHHLGSRSFPPATYTFPIICSDVPDGSFSARTALGSHSRVVFKPRSPADRHLSSFHSCCLLSSS